MLGKTKSTVNAQFVRQAAITALLIAIYRLALYVPLPFVNEAALADFFKRFGGPQISILTLGVMPYISAYILVEICSLFIPPLKRLRNGDYSGRRYLKRIALALALVLATVQGLGIVRSLGNPTLINDAGVFNVSNTHEYALVVAVLVAGTFFLVGIAELISKYGIGNGISMILFAAVCGRFSRDFRGSLRYYDETGPGIYLFSLIVFFVIGFLIIAMLRSKKPVPVRHRLSEETVQHFQLNTCPSGRMAINFAFSILLLPATFSSFLDTRVGLVRIFTPGTIAYYIVLGLFVFLVSYLFAWLFLRPKTRIKKMSERGWEFVEGNQAIQNRLMRRALIYNIPWAMLLCVLAVLPQLLISRFNVPFYIGGSLVYLAIAIGLDIIERYAMQRRSQSGSLVKIAEFHDVYDAAMVRNHVESEGIPALVQGFHHRCLLYFFGPYIDIALMVPQTDVETSKDLIKNYYNGLGLLEP